MPFIGALMGSLTVGLVAYILIPKMISKEMQNDKDDEIFEQAMRCKCECNMYKKLYEDLSKRHNELLDKYEELYKQKGE